MIKSADGYYNLYLIGSLDKAFNITNIPSGRSDKKNAVWQLAARFGPIWPFVTEERDGDRLGDIYNIPPEQNFSERIGDDLDLSLSQRLDLTRRWEKLSMDPAEVVDWLKDLQGQGVTKVTDQMVDFYADPIGYMAGN